MMSSVMKFSGSAGQQTFLSTAESIARIQKKVHHGGTEAQQSVSGSEDPSYNAVLQHGHVEVEEQPDFFTTKP